MIRFRAGLLLAFFALAGCGDDAPVTPAPLPPPAPVPPPAPAPGPDAIPIGFGGVLPAPGGVLILHPGAEFLVPVMADGDLSDYERRTGWTGIPVRVVTDAPASVLAVPGDVAAQGWHEPALLTIRALEPEGPADFEATYTIRLEPPPTGFPERFGLSFRLEAEPIRVRLADPGAEPADCNGLSLTRSGAVRRGDGGAVGENWFGELGRDFRSADLVFRSSGRGAELRLVSAYQPLPYRDFGDAYNLVPVMFAFGLDLEARGDGFEQTLSLGWFDELRLRAAIPGCPQVELHCDDRGRCRTR